MQSTRFALLLLVGLAFQGCCNCCLDNGYPVWKLRGQTPLPCKQEPWERCGPYVPRGCENAVIESYTEQTVGHHFF